MSVATVRKQKLISELGAGDVLTTAPDQKVAPEWKGHTDPKVINVTVDEGDERFRIVRVASPTGAEREITFHENDKVWVA